MVTQININLKNQDCNEVLLKSKNQTINSNLKKKNYYKSNTANHSELEYNSIVYKNKNKNHSDIKKNSYQ